MSHNYSSLPTGEFDEDDVEMSGHALAKKKLKEQDQNLNILESSVGRLGELSLTISKEIDLQNIMLTKLDEDAEAAQSRTDVLIKKTKELVAKSGGTKNFCIIVVLTLILLFLIFLVINT